MSIDVSTAAARRQENEDARATEVVRRESSRRRATATPSVGSVSRSYRSINR